MPLLRAVAHYPQVFIFPQPQKKNRTRRPFNEAATSNSGSDPMPVGRESPRAHFSIPQGLERLWRPFRTSIWARGDSRPTSFLAPFGSFSLSCFLTPRLFESSWRQFLENQRIRFSKLVGNAQLLGRGGCASIRRLVPENGTATADLGSLVFTLKQLFQIPACQIDECQ
ncbi:MAG: hypothetical protein ACI9VS_003841 [Candidatus Binatia bacterium]|jgi:hypothetical protein